MTRWEDLPRCVLRFRDAIESTTFTKDNPSMMDFPNDCCHHASMLLGAFLFDKGFGVPVILSGKHPSDAKAQHHWLRVGVYDVDITADQGNFGQPAVIVLKNSTWHLHLCGKPVRGLTFDEKYWRGIRTRVYHGPIYERILANIVDK